MIVQALYKLVSLIDYLVFKLAATMVNVNLDIAGKEIFDEVRQIKPIANRIYIVVGVLMLFKLVIAAIQYMINPDTFDDKDKGVVGILKNTAISIGLMVLAPAIFNFMITIQGTIVETIPNIVFGNQEKTDAAKTSEDMSFTVLSSFISVNEKSPNKGGSVGSGGEIHDLESFRDHAAEGCGGGVFGDANNCKYSYMVIISTLAGGFLCYVLMSMTLDVAIRTIKFSLIRILAPIPISSYVFGKDKFNKFVKTTMTVYCDLFIRLAIIYFIIFAVEQVISSNFLGEVAGDKGWFYNAIVNVAIIGGLFMFAKTAPKFITELLGLPDIGSGDMKDMFKPAWQRYGGLAGAAINPARTAAGNALTSWQQSKNLRGSWLQRTRRLARAVGAGARGVAEGTVDSAKGLAAGDDWSKMRQRMKDRDTKSFKRAYRANYFRTQTRTDAAKQKLSQRVSDFKSFIGQTPVDSKGYSDAASAISSLRSESFTGRAKGEVDKAPAMFRNINSMASQTTAAGGTLLSMPKVGKDKNGNYVYQYDSNGKQVMRGVATTFSITDAAGNVFNNVDYEKLHELQIKIQNGSATDADYESVTYVDAAGNLTNMKDAHVSASVASDVHERVGKKAYSEYVDIAYEAQKRIDISEELKKKDPRKLTDEEKKLLLTDSEKQQLSGLADREVLDRIARFRETIVGMNIPDKEKGKMLSSLEKDPGGWLAGANKDSQRFSTMATQMAKMEQASSGKKDS